MRVWKLARFSFLGGIPLRRWNTLEEFEDVGALDATTGV